MTPVELQTAFQLNSDFDYPVDVVRARRFIQVCRKILGAGVEEWQHGGSERIRFNLKYIQQECDRAIEFVKANDSNYAPAANTFGSLENFRA